MCTVGVIQNLMGELSYPVILAILEKIFSGFLACGIFYFKTTISRHVRLIAKTQAKLKSNSEKWQKLRRLGLIFFL